VRQDTATPLRNTQSREKFFVSGECARILQSYDLAPSLPPPPLSRQQVVSLSQPSCVSPVKAETEGGGEGGAKSEIIRLRESLVLYKSLNTLWAPELTKHNFIFYPIPQTKLTLSNALNFTVKKVARPKIKNSTSYRRLFNGPKLSLVTVHLRFL
jgi:hypothetical protein